MILAVDDSEIILNFIEHSLNGKYPVTKAKDGKSAINILKDNDVYAILLDLNMPGSDGFEVLSYLKENELITKIPVVIITGDDNKETIEKAFSYPILDVLNKPFTIENMDRILDTINNFYERKKQEIE